MLVRVPQKRVPEQLVSSRSLVRILGQTRADERLKIGGPSFVDRRWVFVQNVENHFILWQSDPRCVTVRHLHRKDANGPYVDLCCVASLALNQLWRHPADSSDFAGAGRCLLSQLDSVAEVCKLDIPIDRHQQIVRLDVAVNYVSFVQQG